MMRHGDQPKWWQRYGIVKDHFKPHGPIILQVVQEDVEQVWEKSLAYTYAKELRGTAVFLEHRYFGPSLPYGPRSNETQALAALTLDDVLADAKTLIEMLRKTDLDHRWSPVIVTGSGYEGFIAMALRQMYPDFFFAAIARAPPNLSLNLNPAASNAEQYLYRNAVAAAWRRRSPYAASQITKVIDWVGHQVNGQPHMLESLQKLLGLCTKPRLGSKEDTRMLQRFVEGSFILASLADNPYTGGNNAGVMAGVVNELMHMEEHPVTGYGHFLRWLDDRVLSGRPNGLDLNCIPWAGLNNSQVTDERVSRAWRTMRYIGCTYYPLCTANAEAGGIFRPQTQGCLEEQRECFAEFEGYAVPMKQNDIWRRYKLGPEDLAKSSRIILSVDKSDPVRSLLGAWPRGASWNSCNYSRRIEYDEKALDKNLVRPHVTLISDPRDQRSSEMPVRAACGVAAFIVYDFDDAAAFFVYDFNALSSTTSTSMSASTIVRGVRVAIEGCGHGTLNAIYASVAQSCKARGWDDGVDLVIIGGDFQAARNAADLSVMSVPAKYRQLGDFPDFYSGARVAPYLTVFIGGNHEASSHLWELYYGGWVAKNIYYLGAANVVRFGPLRIAALSGIWKGHDYRKPHHERLPFNQDDIKSFYHVDVGLSHDWPRAIEKDGDSEWLFRRKPDFRQESMDGRLGSVAAQYVMDRLRPAHWFSAHLHVKFAAIKKYGDKAIEAATPIKAASPSPEANPDEIDLDMDDGDGSEPAAQKTSQVPDELRAQLPASFAPPPPAPEAAAVRRINPGQPVPPGIINTEVRFLALDKCLPGRRFLQLCEIQPISQQQGEDRRRLQYDAEWLSICRLFHKSLTFGGDRNQPPAQYMSEEEYLPLLEAERAWVEEEVVKADKLEVPENFEVTAPPYVAGDPERVDEQPEEYTNPQTAAFCDLLGVENLWDGSAEERRQRRDRGPAPNQRAKNQFRPRAGKGGGGGGGGGGATSFQLRQYAEVTLGGGSLRKVVKLPEGEDENEWLAVNMVDFYNQINLLYGAITEFCSPQSCPEMKATDEFEYLWQDSENYKRPTKMAAPAYIEQLMAWVQSNIDNESILPSKIGVPFPKSFPTLVRQIFKRMYRVYAHIYCHHYPVIRELGLEPHLNTSFKQYVLFIDEHGLASGRDYWGPLGDLVDSMLRSD
ncbi:hypothetical protein L249_2443 [Ophiocordyceps polyrhachis-furcata BCC 54312]|uniref:Lariat debranching enzyme C-terminal domain-containing protein n=1 Tax=Ophiocordyceps polyrhachis-furcata BCC 54312 TaxID=1330021 RepID=A0A367LSL8_9HYPO|nr:hypothetical protein L249_2443 [Ophiocordyceps polyrhachis-furcata BCC 54312]